MSKYGPDKAFIVVAGCDLSPDTFQMAETVEQIIEEHRGFSLSWDVCSPVGVGRVMLEASGGPYEDKVAGMVEAFRDMGATAQMVAWGCSGGAPGATVTMLNGVYSNVFKRMAQKEGLTKAHATHTVSGAYMEGRLLHGLSVLEGAAGNTEGADSVDNGASTANGLTADLHVPELTLGGFTNLIYRVRHSSDDVTYADLITFAAVTQPGTALRQTSAGLVNRHLASAWAYTGAGSGQSHRAMLAAARG